MKKWNSLKNSSSFLSRREKKLRMSYVESQKVIFRSFKVDKIYGYLSLVRKKSVLTDTGENVQKWTRVFSTRRWVVARMRRKKKKNTRVHFWTFSTVEKFRVLAFIG